MLLLPPLSPTTSNVFGGATNALLVLLSRQSVPIAELMRPDLVFTLFTLFPFCHYHYSLPTSSVAMRRYQRQRTLTNSVSDRFKPSLALLQPRLTVADADALGSAARVCYIAKSSIVAAAPPPIVAATSC